METKDINKIWTIKNGEAAETWLNLNDLIKYIDEWSKELDEWADDLIEIHDERETALSLREKADVLNSLYIELLKELK